MRTKAVYLFSTLLLITYSCNKSNDDDVDVSNSTFETEASVYSEELEKSADAVSFDHNLNLNGMNNGNGPNGPGNCLPECVTITVDYPDGGSFPKVVTLDYGEENCQVRPNLFKRGKIIITLTDSIVNVGAQRLVTFDSFYINDNLVTGSRTLTNGGENADSYITFDIENSISIGNWSRETTGSKIWLEGIETMTYEDNVFLLTGSSSSTRPNGVVVNRTITESLKIDRSCAYIIEGILSIESGDNTAIIDFGDGECDDIAIITRDGQEFEIDLDDFGRRRRH